MVLLTLLNVAACCIAFRRLFRVTSIGICMIAYLVELNFETNEVRDCESEKSSRGDDINAIACNVEARLKARGWLIKSTTARCWHSFAVYNVASCARGGIELLNAHTEI